jgi:hypothetical protein
MTRTHNHKGEGVYLLHFDHPYKHAGHYLGWGKPVAARVATHRAGRGVPLTRAVVEEGIGMQLARVWPGQHRDFEYHLRRRHNNRHLCPICNPSAYMYPAARRARKGDCPF